MDDINSVTLLGRLTADPELRSLASGTSVCSFRLAFNTSKKVDGEWEDHPNFVGVTVWGRQGESCNRFLAKGKQVAINGRLQYREWEGESGKRSALDIVAERVQFIGPKDGDTSTTSSSSRSQQPPAVADDDDIPF